MALRQKSPARFSRQFYEIGGSLDPQPKSKKSNSKRSGRKFSRNFYNVGAALKGKQSLASLGSQSGPFAVAFEGLNRVGDSLLDQSYDEQKKQAVETGGRQGLEEASAAFRENRMVQLRQDDTISAQAYNKTLQASYLARLDTSIEGISKFHQARNSENAEGFSKGFDKDARKLLENLPPEWRGVVEAELLDRKGKILGGIDAAVVKSEGLKANADLFGKMDSASGQWLEGIRQSYMLDEADPAQAQVVADIAASRAKFIGALDSVFGITPEAKAEALAKIENDARKEHVLGAFGGAYRAGRGEEFIRAFGRAGLDDDGFEPADRRKLVKILEAENTKGREQALLVHAQSIADTAAVDFDTEAEAVAYVRKNFKGALEAKAIAQVRGRFADKDKATKANTEALWSELETAKASGATAAQMGEIRNRAPTRADRKAMGEFIGNAAKRQEPETDFEALYDFRQMESEERIKIDLFSEFRNKLNDADFKQAIDLQEADKAALGKAEMTPAHAATLTFTQRVNIALSEAGLTGKGSNAKKRAAKFTTEAARQIHRFEVSELEGKRKATGDEMQKIVTRMIDEKVTLNDNWFADDTQLPAAAVTGKDFKEGVTVPIKEIEPAAVKRAKAALVEMGVKGSDDHIEKLVAAQRMNGKRGVTEWFRLMGVTGPKATTNDAAEAEETLGLPR